MTDDYATSDTTRQQPESSDSSLRADAVEARDDVDLLEQPRRFGIHRTTQILLIGIAVAISFAAGVPVQKQHDAGLATASAGFSNLLAARGAGGLFGPGAPQSGSGNSLPPSPVLIGTVVAVSSDGVTIKDFGGATHVVHVGSTTPVSETKQVAVSSLTPGSTVSVMGTRGADGSVSATSLTVR